MLTLVTLLSKFVRKAPLVVVVLAIALTATFGYFIQFAELAEGNEGFAPDAPELEALGDIGDLFGDDSSGQVMQIIVEAPEGGSVLTPEGRQVAAAITAAVNASELGDRLQSPDGQPSVISPFLPMDGAGTGPGIQVVVAADGGDVLTPEGVALAGAVEAAIGSTLGDLLVTDGEQPPLVSFAMPLALVGGGSGESRVIYTLAGPDVISAEGLAAVSSFEAALRGSQLADLLAEDTPFEPSTPSFLRPVMDVIVAGGGSLDMPTFAVKEAYLAGLAGIPESFQGQVTSMLLTDVDLAVPSASSGAIAINFAEPPPARVLDGLAQIAASIPLAEGFQLVAAPIAGEPAPALDTPEAVKAAYTEGSSLLPPELGQFLSFLFGNDFDPASLVGSKGMVTASLTASPSADQSAALDAAIAAIDVPTGYRIGHLPQGADTATFVAAFNDRLSFVPAEQAGFVTALLPAEADIEAGAASHALMVVFLDAAADSDDELAIAEAQGALADDLAALELGGFEALPFSFSLIFAESEGIQDEVARMFSIAGVIIVAILLFVYWVKPHGRLRRFGAIRRTLADTGITLLGIFMAIGWMQGLGVLLGPDYLGIIGQTNQIAQMLPVLLIGLGVDYGIHMTSRFREEAGAGATVEAAIIRSIRTVGIALVLATMTTVVGFLTNLVSPVGALKDFGILAAAGILSSFILMLTFVPALRLLFDRRAERRETWPAADLFASKERVLNKLIGKTSWLARRVPVATVIGALLFGLLGAYGTTQLETKFSFIDFLPEDSPVIQTYNTLIEEFGGGFGETTSILLKGNDLATAAVHNAGVDALEQLADTDDVLLFADQASVDGPFAIIAGLINPVSPTYDAEVAALADQVGLGGDLRVPAGADVASLYAAVGEAQPDAWTLVAHTEGGSTTAMLWTVSTQAGETRAGALRDAMNEDVEPLRSVGVDAVVTSDSIIGIVVIDALQSSQMSSLLITVLASALILVINFLFESKRPALGLVTIAPVVLVVLWTFGMMALTGIPFGPITATISALAIGIGVPYTIHITHRFLEDRLEESTTEDAVHSTATHTGSALAGSAFTTMAGFGSLMTSNLKPFQQFGAVTFYAVGFALLASLLVLPSMLVLWDRWHRNRGDATLDAAAVHRFIDANGDAVTG